MTAGKPFTRYSRLSRLYKIPAPKNNVIGTSMDGADRLSQVTRKRTRENARACSRGTENSSFRIIAGPREYFHNGVEPCAGRFNRPACSRAVWGDRSVPER